MTEAKSSEIRSPNPLHLDRCPDCGYLLTGLPERGQCPECGFVYGPEMIVIYGWGFGERATWSNRRWNPARLASYGIILCLVAGWLALVSTDAPRLMMLVLVLILSVPVWRLIRGLRHRIASRGDEVPPVQVRLTAEGFGLRDGMESTDLRPWSGLRALVGPLRSGGSVGRYRCRIRAEGLKYFVEGDLVDVEFDCGDETAEAIRAQLQEWGVDQ